MRATIIAAAAAALIVTPALADKRTGYQLYTDCSADEGSAYCAIYLLGVSDGMQAAHEAFVATGSTPRLCGDDGTFAGQLRLIFLRWAEQNPKELSRPQYQSAALAMVQAFPCK
jgi:hypothetical protein